MKYAKAGNALAMYDVACGYMYWHKRGTNGAEAFVWLKKSADAGLAKACEEIADAYRNGYLSLQVFKGRESAEHYPVKASSRLAELYDRKAKRVREKMKRPSPRVIACPRSGWCDFTPAKGCSALVSYVTANFPGYVVDVLIARLTRNFPMNITADGEEEVSVFVDTISTVDDDQAFFIQKKQGCGHAQPTVVEVKFNVLSMAKQVVNDIEFDYYGWVKFSESMDYAKGEKALRKKVSELKKAIGFYEKVVVGCPNA